MFKLSISMGSGIISLKQLSLLLWVGERMGRRSDSGVGVGILKGRIMFYSHNFCKEGLVG